MLLMALVIFYLSLYVGTYIVTLLINIVLADDVDLKRFPSDDDVVSLVEHIPAKNRLYHIEVVELLQAATDLGSIHLRRLLKVL